MNVYIRKKDLDYSAMRGPCPEGFHVPNYKEWQAIIDIWVGLWLPDQDWNLYSTYLKLPYAGERGTKWTLSDQGSFGYYWSSYYGGDSYFFWLGHYDDPTATTYGWRAVARSVRAFKDVPAKPDSSWTVVYDWSAVAAWAWIFWNATLWLISLSVDWFSRKTIQDKNLWATNVWDYWSHFQRWNNYWFPSSWTLSDTSDTQVDASGYWPWNYYSSSTYITWSEDWSSVRNDNLWWHSTWTIPIMTTMKNAYVGGYYEYSYDFRNKTISEFAADGWTYDDTKAPSFNSDWIYYTAMTTNTSGGIELNYNLTSAKKITLNTSFVITNSTTHIWGWRIDSASWTYLSWIFLTNMLGSRQQQIQINGSSVSTTSVSVSTWTYTETIEYDLTNKTYTYSGCYPASWTLTDEQISWIRNNNGITVAVGGSSGIKISTIDLVVEY